MEIEDRGSRGLLGASLGVAAAVAALTIGAQIEVWMEPVPMTLQTLALVIAAGLLGPARGALAAATYVGCALAGLPVLSGGHALPGTAFLESTSTGYLVGFVVAAGIAGLGHQRPPWALALLFLIAHGAVLGLGAAWLARHLGWRGAYEAGAAPYLMGGAAKSLVGAAAVSRLRGVGWGRRA